MSTLTELESLDAALDSRYLIEQASRLCRVPTEVPLGFNTYLRPDDPRLVRYVDEFLVPELHRLGCWDILRAGPHAIVRSGGGSGRPSLLIQNYPVVQHHNLMPEPHSGSVANAQEFGFDEPAVFGQGVSQSKINQAIMLTVLKALGEAGLTTEGTLYWAVNCEGESSHASSYAILDRIGLLPDFCLVQFPTANQIALGNRGRIDISIHVVGRASHSSAPEDGLSAIDGVQSVISRLQAITWEDSHPQLGRRHVVPYKIRYEPLAPHTLPAEAWVTVDRRLLPGDDPQEAVEEVARSVADLSPYEVEVVAGPTMLPALVPPDDEGVSVLRESHRSFHGSDPELVYRKGTFDAGGPFARGIPTVMYGTRRGEFPLGTDFVTVSDATKQVRVVAAFVGRHLGLKRAQTNQ